MAIKNILVVKIHNAINKDKKDPYEATRGNWRASKVNTSHSDYVVGLYNGEVLAAYTPSTWHTIQENGKDRRRFDGEPVEQKVFNLLKQNEKLFMDSYNGGSNPIAYVKIDFSDVEVG
jgi:hypothetical protein